MRATRSDHTFNNGRWTLPDGYGVMLESFTPPERRSAKSHPRTPVALKGSSLRSFLSRGRRCPG
jgi:hypothetical protein